VIDRIVVLNDLARPKGGASFLALTSAREFAARGLRVTMITGDDTPLSGDTDGIEFACLGTDRLLERPKLNAVFDGLYHRAGRDHVANWIARNDTPGTVYHLHGWSQILSPSIFDALKPVAPRVVSTAHDFFLTCPNGAHFDFRSGTACTRKPLGSACLSAPCDRRSHAHKLWRYARHAIQRPRANAVDSRQLLIHDAMRPFMRSAGIKDDRMRTVPNPVTAWTQAPVAAASNRDVLFVGRMEATKGIDLAAEACRTAGARLVAIGDGAMLQDLRRKYPEMEFCGRLNPAEIGEHARLSRLLVMPSRHMEPFGLTAVEALWSGLPVITSNRALIASDIVESGAGLAIDPTDVGSFARAISMLLTDDAKVHRMSAAAINATRHLAMTTPEWIDTLLSIYCEILEAQSPREEIGPGTSDRLRLVG